MESSGDERTLINKSMDTALTPFRAAVSKPARKAYLGTFLVIITSITLVCISTVAYWVFYFNYVPQLSLERVIHLQFGNGNPYGTTQLSSELASLQPYDVSVSLVLPRTPSNLAIGNFMLDLSLFSRPANTYLSSNSSITLLGQSRRPAIMTYASPLVDTANRVSQMPWYVLGWKKEAERLEIPMMELVEFAKGWRNLPGSVSLTLDGIGPLQVYSAKVKFIARFSGLRWIMYNYRLLSFFVFTATFYSVAMTSATLAWLALSMWLFPSSSSSASSHPVKPEQDAIHSTPDANGHAHTNGAVKSEESDSGEPVDFFATESLSESQRVFPTFGRQMPLRFPLRNVPVRREDQREIGNGEDEQERIERTTTIEPLGGEADDEDNAEEEDRSGERGRGGGGDGGGRTDSGIGTSLDEGTKFEARRRGRGRIREDEGGWGPP